MSARLTHQKISASCREVTNKESKEDFLNEKDYHPDIKELSFVAQFVVNKDGTVNIKFLGTQIQTNDGKTAEEAFQQPGGILQDVYNDKDIRAGLVFHGGLIYETILK